MSTYLYLQCETHTPRLRADSESGQHLYDLEQIRSDIANRAAIVAAWRDDWRPDDGPTYWRSNTARFLAEHPHCVIGIIDEYGRNHPLTEEKDKS